MDLSELNYRIPNTILKLLNVLACVHYFEKNKQAYAIFMLCVRARALL
jgi:hypothetical protein